MPPLPVKTPAKRNVLRHMDDATIHRHRQNRPDGTTTTGLLALDIPVEGMNEGEQPCAVL